MVSNKMVQAGHVSVRASAAAAIRPRPGITTRRTSTRIARAAGEKQIEQKFVRQGPADRKHGAEMPGTVGDGQEQVGPCHKIEVERGSQDNISQSHDGENLDCREQPVKWNDPDDAMPQESKRRARSVGETARGNHHHESADDEKDIDPRGAVFPIHAGCCGIDTLAPGLESMKQDDEYRCDGAQRLNGEEACG
jgi:hypothetical protein